MNKVLLSGVVALPLMFCAYANAQSAAPPPMTRAPSDSVAPDNTKSNKTDPSNRTAVADQQANNPADIDLAKRIRSSVIADKSLSTYGHNVKIVAVNGMVTLNGVVSSADEKMRIGELATSAAGAGKVIDQLKVVPPK